MTWRNITVEEERFTFIQEALDASTSISFEDLCKKFNISSKTGYKWFNRFLERGREGLKDKSRARLTHPEKITSNIESIIIAIRTQYPTWGPKKIHALMVYDNMEMLS
jgi:putative transposase